MKNTIQIWHASIRTIAILMTLALLSAPVYAAGNKDHADIPGLQGKCDTCHTIPTRNSFTKSVRLSSGESCHGEASLNEAELKRQALGRSREEGGSAGGREPKAEKKAGVEARRSAEPSLKRAFAPARPARAGGRRRRKRKACPDRGGTGAVTAPLHHHVG
jgi:hypothetical protein